jgi:MtrB/PioB family decaheme-associated outer membrane protein
MKLKTIVYILILSLIPLSNAFSEERTIEGNISVTGKIIDVNADGGGKAKFTEYKDLEDDFSLFVRGWLKYDTPTYFLKLDVKDIAYDTQYYRIDGGTYGTFKYDLFYYEIPHNVTFDARTFFDGPGTNRLTINPAADLTDPNTWNTFDYSTERKKYGAGFKLDVLRPYYFDVAYYREEKEGIKAAGIDQDIFNPSATAYELPEPIDYTTHNLKIEAGYGKSPLFLSLCYYLSDFTNDNQLLRFPDISGRPLTLPADSTAYNLAFKGSLKLPYNTKLYANLATGKTDSEHTFWPNYDGEVKTHNYDVVLTTNPVRYFNAKVYYKYYSRNNESTLDNLDTLPFDQRLNTLGVDFGYRLPANLYLSVGYKNAILKRIQEGQDAAAVLPFNRDNIYTVELRWSGLAYATFKAGYEFMKRNADYQTHASQFAPEDPSNRFAYVKQDRDTFKIGADVYPTDNLSFGLGYKYKNNDYKNKYVPLNATIGLEKDTRDEFNVDADYTLGKIAKLFGYFDYEKIKLKQSEIFDRAIPRWRVKQTDKTYDYGIGADIYVIKKKLTLRLVHDYVKSDGLADYSIPAAVLTDIGLSPGDDVDISNWDDYKLRLYKIEAIYYATKSMTLSLGYAYEGFDYSDAQLDGYEFIPADAFLTGAYKDQSYSANIIFVRITYNF